jgi:hypothetical protein
VSIRSLHRSHGLTLRHICPGAISSSRTTPDRTSISGPRHGVLTRLWWIFPPCHYVRRNRKQEEPLS